MTASKIRIEKGDLAATLEESGNRSHQDAGFEYTKALMPDFLRVLLCLAGSFLLLLNSALASDLQSSFKPGFPLSQLKSFAFSKQDRKSPDGLASAPETERLIRENLQAQFVAVGLQVTDRDPDFLFAFYAKSVLRTRWRSASSGGWGGAGNAAPEGYELGTLVVDIVHRESNQVVWHGVATKALNYKPEKANAVIREGCEKLAKRFKKDVKKQSKTS
ncbi:MAG: DUF4136 domain-containing protein [Terriglobia bacterium]